MTTMVTKTIYSDNTNNNCKDVRPALQQQWEWTGSRGGCPTMTTTRFDNNSINDNDNARDNNNNNKKDNNDKADCKTMALLSKTCQVFPAVWLSKSLLESAVKEAGLQVLTCRWKESKKHHKSRKMLLLFLEEGHNPHLSVPKSKRASVFWQSLKS